MVDFNRNQAIKGALDMGQSVDQINTGLQSIGQNPLTEYEQVLIRNDAFGKSLGQRTGEGAMRFAQGLGTILASPFQYATNEDFRGAVNRTVGDYAQKFISGQTNPIEDFANMVLSPYDNVKVDDIFRNPVESGRRILYGAAAHPFDAILDTATFVPTGAVARGLSKVPNEGFQSIRRAVMPTNRERQINTLLNFGGTNAPTRRLDFEKRLTEVTTDPNLERSITDLTSGTVTPEIKASRERTKQFIEDMNTEMVKLGLDPSAYKTTTITQRVRDILDPDGTKNIYNQNVQKAIDNPIKENLDAIGISNKTELDNLVQDASKAFDEGRLALPTQRGIMNEVDHRLVDLENLGSGINRQRTFGVATPQQIARNFDRGYRNLYSVIERAQNSTNTLEELATKFGRGITPEEIGKIRKGEVIISPTEFKDGVSTLFGRETRGNIEKLASDLERGANPNTIKKYANDLYAIPKSDLKAFVNYAKGIDYSTGTGRFIQSAKPIMGAFKSNVLARPSYIVGNRIGNVSLGLIGGADYVTAMKPGMIEKYVPDYIKQSTSFHGYDAVNTNNPIIAWRDSANRLRNAMNELRDPTTTVGERVAAGGEVLRRSQEMVTPIRQLFQAEAALELRDRAAVYFSEARKYARETSQSMDEVLDKALTNNELQRTLIDRVNSVLGDYVGRNYYINPNIREALATISPFYKVITTSADVGLQQLRRNPLRMQAFARIPSRIGNEIQRVDRELGYQPSDTDPRGGMVIEPTYSRRFPAKVMFNNYHPLSAPTEIVQSILGPAARQGEGTGLAGIGGIVEGNITPLVGLANILSGKDPYGNPALGPNSYKIGNKIITLDNNGNEIQQQPDILGAGIGYLGRYFTPSATMYNATIGPLYGALTGRNFYSPTNRSIFGQIGDTPTIPYLVEGRQDRPTGDELKDWTASQLGMRTRDVYFPYRNQVSPYDMRQLNRRLFMQQQRLNRGN